jgi:hypothetical protein
LQHPEIAFALFVQASALLARLFQSGVQLVDGLVTCLQGQFEAAERGLFGSQLVAQPDVLGAQLG